MWFKENTLLTPPPHTHLKLNVGLSPVSLSLSSTCSFSLGCQATASHSSIIGRWLVDCPCLLIFLTVSPHHHHHHQPLSVSLSPSVARWLYHASLSRRVIIGWRHGCCGVTPELALLDSSNCACVSVCVHVLWRVCTRIWVALYWRKIECSGQLQKMGVKQPPVWHLQPPHLLISHILAFRLRMSVFLQEDKLPSSLLLYVEDAVL